MFNDRQVDTKVKYQLNIFDGRDPKEEELKKVQEIFLSNFNARGEVINTDISEITRLKNLKILDLKGFEITDEISNIFNELSELEVIKLYSCYSKSSINCDIESLKNLVLDNCKHINLSEFNLPENVLIVNGGNVDLSSLLLNSRLNNLEIKNSAIFNSDLLKSIKNLKYLNIDGSTLDNDEVLNKLGNVSISKSYDYFQMK